MKNKLTTAQVYNYVLGLVRRDYPDLLEVLKKFEVDKHNPKIIRNAKKLLDGIKVVRYLGERGSFNIYANELNDILYGKDKKEAFYQFIGRAYSKKAEQMLRDSGMNLEHIDSFEIFKEEFIEKLEKHNIKLGEIIKAKINDIKLLQMYIILNKLKECYKENPEIISVLETINVDTRSRKMIERARVVLSNERISENINAEVLISIIKEDDNSYNNICQLVGKTYGKEAEEILRERPRLTMRDIPNFDIFDKNIQEMIGYGGVHTFLTYYMDSDHVITYIANNPDMVRYYKAFEELTQDYFPPSACGLEERLIVFYKNKDLINQIIDSGHPNDFKEKLLLYLEDRKNLSILTNKNVQENRYSYSNVKRTFFPENDLKVETLEELEHYKETRNAILKKYSEEEKCYTEDLMRFKYFGSLPAISDLRNMEKMLQDYMKLNQTDMTNDELDLIELYLIFRSITDKDVLESLDELLSQNEDVITPLHIRAISHKIAENYKKEYLDSLFSIEDARKMSEESEEIINSKSDSIQKNEASKSLSRRYILKKGDDNMYFSDHLRTPNGVKKYQDCIVTEKEDTTTYSFTYKCKDGEEISKEVIRTTIAKNQVSEQVLYKMGDIGFYISNGEICSYGQISTTEQKERLKNFIQTYEQRLKDATLIQQYNPEEKFKLEKDDVEGFIVHGIHSNKLCISLIRKGSRPTSDYFSYGKLDRL